MPVPGFNRPGDGTGGLKIPDKLNFVANLNNKGQPATMADSVANLINKITGLGNVGSKKWASGTVTSSSTTSSFTDSSGTGTSLYTATVSGLTFQPSTIIVYKPNATTSFSVYRSGNIINSYEIASTVSSGIFVQVGVGACYVNATGFRMGANLQSTLLNWVAYE